MMAIHNEWDPACKVWIGNLGNEGTKLEIEDAFSEIGTVKNIWLAKNPPGFAFVEMDDPRDAEDSVKALNNTMLCGMRVHVQMARGREKDRAREREKERRERRKSVERTDKKAGSRERRGKSADRIKGSRDLSRDRARKHSRERSKEKKIRKGSRDRSKDRRDRRSSRERSKDRNDRRGSRERSADKKDRRGSRDRSREKLRKGSRERSKEKKSRKGSRDRSKDRKESGDRNRIKKERRDPSEENRGRDKDRKHKSRERSLNKKDRSHLRSRHLSDSDEEEESRERGRREKNGHHGEDRHRERSRDNGSRREKDKNGEKKRVKREDSSSSDSSPDRNKISKKSRRSRSRDTKGKSSGKKKIMKRGYSSSDISSSSSSSEEDSPRDRKRRAGYKKNMDLSHGTVNEDFLEESVETMHDEAFRFMEAMESVEVAEKPNLMYRYSVPGPLADVVDQDLGEEEDRIFKIKYKEAKKQFFKSVEKHEYLKNELRTRQKKLQQVEEDKYFVMERLLLYEKIAESPSELSDGSDSESDVPVSISGGRKKDGKGSRRSGVKFSSAYTKMKSISGGKRTRRPATKTKLFDEVFGPSTVGSFAPFEDENQSSSFLSIDASNIYNRSAMDDSE